MAEVEWIEDAEALAALAPEWDALLLRSGVDDPFLTSDFLITWWRHFGAGRGLRVAAVRAAGVLWGGLPLYAERARGRVWLRFPGAEDFALANRTELLAPVGSIGALEAVTRALAERDDWDVLELARVQQPPAEVDALVEVFEHRGHLLRHRHAFPRFLIDVPAEPEDYLLFFGRIHPDKGARQAIQIAAAAGRRLIMAGLIQDERYHELEVKPHLDGNRVTYLGSVGPAERDRLLGGAAALLHPISFNEPFGLSVVESMACGTPVIAFNLGSMPELIRQTMLPSRR